MCACTRVRPSFRSLGTFCTYAFIRTHSPSRPQRAPMTSARRGGGLAGLGVGGRDRITGKTINSYGWSRRQKNPVHINYAGARTPARADRLTLSVGGCFNTWTGFHYAGTSSPDVRRIFFLLSSGYTRHCVFNCLWHKCGGVVGRGGWVFVCI